MNLFGGAGLFESYFEDICMEINNEEAVSKLEEAAKNLSAIARERAAIKGSDKPYRDAAPELAELDKNEKAVLADIAAYTKGADGEEAEDDSECSFDKFCDDIGDAFEGLGNGIEDFFNGLSYAVSDLG
jgi:hypothetical protein